MVHDGSENTQTHRYIHMYTSTQIHINKYKRTDINIYKYRPMRTYEHTNEDS